MIQHALVITEIMADPTPSFGLPEAEYIEVFNGASSPLNLSDFDLYDGTSRTISDYIIGPGEYVIICDDDDTSLFSSYGNVAYVSSLTLTNGGEPVVLYDQNGHVIDSVFYSTDWFGSTFKEEGGWSLERVDKEFSCNDPGNWKPSEDITGGTPARANSVDGVFTDSSRPLALNAYSISDTEIVVRFTEPVEPLLIAQFHCNELGPVIHADYHIGRKDMITVSFSSQMMPSQTYEMVILNFKDCTGNITLSDTVNLGLPSHHPSNRVRINEILYDPSDGCPEFIEVINVSDSIIDLADYEICKLNPSDGYIESVHKITEEPYLLFIGREVYLSEDPDGVADCYISDHPHGALHADDLPSLLNSGGRLGVMYLGEVIDDIQYNDDMHHPLLFSTRGVSLELIDLQSSGFHAGNWMSASSASGYGTPGFKNSQTVKWMNPDDWLTVDPVVFTPDNDGNNDYTTIWIQDIRPGYVSKVRIFDLEGRSVKDFPARSVSAGSDKVIWRGETDERKVLTPGPYIIHVTVLDHKGNKRTGKLMTVISY
jgi:hypothetical protein